MSQSEIETMTNEKPIAQPPQSLAPPEIFVSAYPEQSIVPVEQPSETNVPISQALVVVDVDGSTAVGREIVVAVQGGESRKRRGRPRKYGPGGILERTGSTPGNMPLASARASKRRDKKKQKLEECEFFGLPLTVAYFYVEEGEDITEKIISFSEDVGRSICVLSASGGYLSSATLKQPFSDGIVTHEGTFGIVCLKGSWMLTEHEGQKCTKGGLSVTLYSRDFRVFGGNIVGPLVAAATVQVIVGLLPMPGTTNSIGHTEPEPETPRPAPVGRKAGSGSPLI